MIKKIKGSIGLKTFISMMSLLMVCCVLIYGLVLYFLPKNYQTELESQFTTDFQSLIENLETNGWENSSQAILTFSMKNNASVQVTDENQTEVFEVNAAVSEEMGSAGKSLGTTAQFSYENKTYTVNAIASFAAVSQSYDVLLKLLPLIIVVIIFIALIGAFVCSCSFSKPLVEICGVAKRMANLDMTWKCNTSRSDEVGVLAESLNEMSARLSDALESLQTANEQLQRDIEKERRQEKQRVDFFTSVSHELKTPLTVIKGELEGMVYQVGDYKDRDTYLRHSLKTVTDMEKLVKEILMAAKMGGSDFELSKADLNINELMKSCRHKIDGILEDKEMNLHMELPSDFYFEGDERLLQQALSNIVGNAAFYSPEKADITIHLYGNCLSVENSGVHINDEDLEQIFTPFFRADKSRSRNTGGSGLGLYIAKTIFDHHGISYRMENTENGIRFTVIFPQ